MTRFSKFNQRLDKFFDTSEFKPVKFSKRAKYSLLAALTLLNIAMRWPWYNHEVGFDTTYIHSMINSISYYGTAKWSTNPFSFVGLTPDTYPAGYLYLVSGLSQISGLTIENTLILFGIWIGIFGIYSAYMVSCVFFEDERIRLFIAGAFSLSPIFIRWTMGTSTPRILFISLLPIFIFILVHNLKRKYFLNIILMTIFFFVFYSIHRMSILLIVPIGFYILCTYFFTKERLTNKIYWRIGFVLIIFIMLLLFLLQLTSRLLPFENNYRWQSGFLFTGDSYPIMVLNLLLDYGSRYGLLYLISLLGISFIVFKIFNQRNDINQIFIYLIIIFLFPLILLWGYLSMFLLIFFGLIIGYGLIICFKDWNKSVKMALNVFIIFLCISSLVFSSFMIIHWDKIRYTGDYAERTEYWNYNCAMYLNENGMNHDLESNTEWVMFIEPYLDIPDDYSESEDKTLTAASFETFMTQDSLFEESLARKEEKLHEFQSWEHEDTNEFIEKNKPTMIRYNRFVPLWPMLKSVEVYKYKVYESKEISIYCL